jgi:archaetidylinositol phosphate synthase
LLTQCALTSLRLANIPGGETQTVQARRVNDSALGVLERPALAWLARRVPRRMTPDHLTLIGLSGALAAAAAYFASRWSIQWLWLASAGLAVNWAGDSLDGTVARLRGAERQRYGFFVDHTTDLFSQSLIFLALGASPCTRFGVAAIALIAFLVAFVYSLICFKATETMRITYFRFGPTEIRALLVIGNLLTLAVGVLDLSRWWAPLGVFGRVTVYELFIVAICLLMLPSLALLAIRESRALALVDPPPTASMTPLLSVETDVRDPTYQPAATVVAADGI